MDSLLLPDGMITTDPVLIHDRLTEAFAEQFVCPQQHIQSPLQTDNGIEQERFLTDETNFKTIVSQILDKIPKEALNSIWYRISHVPK